MRSGMLWRLKQGNLCKAENSTPNSTIWTVQIWLAPPSSAMWGHRSYEALIDTGSSVPLAIGVKIAKRLGLKAGKNRRVPLTAGQALNASESFVDIRIGDLTVIGVPCLITGDPEDSDDSQDPDDPEVILGAPLLQLFRVSLDDKAATLIPNPDAIHRWLDAWDSRRSRSSDPKDEGSAGAGA